MFFQRRLWRLPVSLEVGKKESAPEASHAALRVSLSPPCHHSLRRAFPARDGKLLFGFCYPLGLVLLYPMSSAKTRFLTKSL
jgi:hypothetical protein